MKLLFDESLSYKLAAILSDLFPDSQSALRNGLAGRGDLAILNYASAGEFLLVTTDSDFIALASRTPGTRVVIRQSCNYPTHVAADILRRNAIRIGELATSADRILLLNPPNR